MWRTAEGSVPQDGEPLNLALGRAIKRHDREDPDSFWSQCGNMSSKEEAGIIRGEGKPQGREQGGGGNHL